MVSFMGIGLVDPILPSIADKLHATQTQSELLFTTYLAMTGAAMFFTSWVSSRIGTKRTLIIGLSVVVLFSIGCAFSPSVWTVIGFRAGWGVGNALFISTALAAMVSAAVGGSASAIILYEAALGIGMAIGPLVGGTLGTISWRVPFSGTAVLMAVGVLGIAVMLRHGHSPHPAPVRLSAPFKALTDRGMGTISVAAFFYNMAFFTTLAFPPFALDRLGVNDPIEIGLVFFGWGGMLAISAVTIAPRLTQVLRRTTVVMSAEVMLALFLVGCALLSSSAAGLIVCVILAGLPLGLLNTVLTECSMEASTLPRPVASSTYSGCRFLGGAVAPPFCTFLAHATTVWAPFLYGALMILISAGIIAARRGALARADGDDTVDAPQVCAGTGLPAAALA
ncbi:MAG: MFS transporter [Actinomycetia bacterium]|nr:MFS transporter [Actinomycetes bacterium]